MRKTHKDVEYHVTKLNGETEVLRTTDKAAGLAVSIGMSNGLPVHIDVVICSESGARSYGGDDAVEQYREDPDASVFERIEIKVNSEGRVP